MFGEEDNVKATFCYRDNTGQGNLGITGTGAIKGGIMPWKQAGLKVNKVTIGPGISKVGSETFSRMTDMTSVTIGDDVKEIGDYAFLGCSKLKTLELNNVTKVGKYAFNACSSLESVSKNKLGEWSLGQSAFHGCKNLKKVESQEPFAVSENTFSVCHEELILTWYEWQQPTIPYYKISYQFKDKTLKLLYGDGYVGERDYQLSNDNRPSWNRDSFKVTIYNVDIGEGIKRIGNEAFKGMSEIENVSISNSVNSIGDSAFEECVTLTKIKIPNSVDSVGKEAFSGCTTLNKVDIYNPEMTFETGVFKNCDKDKLLIRSYQDSTAHDYAYDNNIKFEPFDGNYCRIEFYYDRKLDDSLTWEHQVIDLNESINENSDIIQKAKKRGQKNGFKYDRFETQLGEMSKNNVIKVYYTKDSSTNPAPGGKDPSPGETNPGGTNPGETNPGGTSPGGTNPGSNNQGGGSNGNGNGSNGNGNATNSNANGSNGGGASSSTGTSSKGNGKTITGSASDSLASKIIPKTGLEIGLLVGIITLSGVAVVCYKKSKWN